MTKTIYLIAGEASGDYIGAQLMKALKVQNPDCYFVGIGGEKMQRMGLQSLFPIEELSVMGVAEILPRLRQILGRIKQTINHVQEMQPDILVTIDSPDFSFRVQKAVRFKGGNRPKQYHYVAPTVWAWREKRANKVANFLDGIICLFDFEPPYFEQVGLPAIAVGHPMMESGILQAQPALIGSDEALKLGLFLGSRRGELKRTAPTIIEAVQALIDKHQNIELIVPTLPHLEDAVAELLSGLDVPKAIIAQQGNDKWSIFKTCDVAIAVSGTVGLELAVADVPHVIAYKAAPVTAFFVRRMLKTPYAHLANIMLTEYVVPELIQEDCTPEMIKQSVTKLLFDPQALERQKRRFDDVRERLATDVSPSQKAAKFVLQQ